MVPAVRDARVGFGRVEGEEESEDKKEREGDFVGLCDQHYGFGCRVQGTRSWLGCRPQVSRSGIDGQWAVPYCSLSHSLALCVQKRRRRGNLSGRGDGDEENLRMMIWALVRVQLDNKIDSHAELPPSFPNSFSLPSINIPWSRAGAQQPAAAKFGPRPICRCQGGSHSCTDTTGAQIQVVNVNRVLLVVRNKNSP